MLDYGDGNTHSENTMLAIIDTLKYRLAGQNIRIDLLDHLLAQAAANAVPACPRWRFW